MDRLIQGISSLNYKYIFPEACLVVDIKSQDVVFVYLLQKRRLHRACRELILLNHCKSLSWGIALDLVGNKSYFK